MLHYLILNSSELYFSGVSSVVSGSLTLSSSVAVLVDSLASLVSLVLLSVSLSVFSDLFSLSSSSLFSLTLRPSSSWANLLLSC